MKPEQVAAKQLSDLLRTWTRCFAYDAKALGL